MVYFYQLGASGWSLVQTVSDPGHSSVDDFGQSVAISGGMALIGAPGAPVGGVAYFYQLGASGWQRSQEEIDTVGVSSDDFGAAVAISGDNAVIGAWGTTSDQGAAYFYQFRGGGWTQDGEFNDPGATNLDEFGSSLALSGTNAVIGADADDLGTGAAYFYELGASGWTQLVSPADPGAAGDGYGGAVAISGGTAVIGVNASANKRGGAYVLDFGANGWSIVQVLNYPDAAADADFGYRVAVSDSKILVAADGIDAGQGAVYVYDLDVDNSTQSPAVVIHDPGAAKDYFGSAIALSGDEALVGTSPAGTSAGVAYTVDLASGTWLAGASASGTKGFDREGLSVFISGDSAIVGEPGYPSPLGQGQVFFFKRELGQWQSIEFESDPNATNDDFFGQSVAISGDWALVGAPGADANEGAAYFYQWRNGSWSPSTPVTDANLTAGDLFGSAVALSGDNAVIGADGSGGGTGLAFFYRLGTSLWSFVTKVNDAAGAAGYHFGDAVAIDGINAVVGEDGTPAGGAVHFYQFNGALWASGTSANDPADNANDDFADAVALSGSDALVGASGDGGGVAYVWSLESSGWVVTATLGDPATGADDGFGSSVALSGTNALVGSVGSTNESGSVYAYNRTTSWQRTSPLTNPTANSLSYFGVSVALAGAEALVGATVGSTTNGDVGGGTAQFYDEATSQAINPPAAQEPQPWSTFISVAATSSSGLPVDYGVSVPGSTAADCRVTSSGDVSASSGGRCEIDLEQDGSASVAPAVTLRVAVGFTAVMAKPLRVANATHRSPDTAKLALVSSGGSGTGAVSYRALGRGCVVKRSVLSVTRATSCIVRATEAATTAYLSVTSKPVAFSFALATQPTLRIANTKLTTTTHAVKLVTSGGAGSGRTTFTVSGTQCALHGSTLRASAATTCVVRAHRGASALYRAATSMAKDFVFTE